MKNLIMSIVTLLLIVLSVQLMLNGIAIGNFEILSIQQIKEKNRELDEMIETVNSLNNIMYKKKLSDLNEITKKLVTSKTEYLDVASVSTDEEIKQANQTKIYSMEYLWSQVGNHATKQGVNIKMEVVAKTGSDICSLNFSVDGSYIAIRNYVYALENDQDLLFRIESFKMIHGGVITDTSEQNTTDTEGETKTETKTEEYLTATFSVQNIKIKKENAVTTIKTEAEKTAAEEEKNKENSESEDTGNTNTTEKNTENIIG